MANDVAVMYAGEVVENAPTEQLFRSPKHPYTQCLFASLPSRQQRGQDLVTLEGVVPDPLNWPKGCRFQPRCPKRFEPCPTVHPELGRVEGEQTARCLLYESAWPKGTAPAIPTEAVR
jgi:oligopeptide/dipeptide ABC transporter ATP-binding protein